MKQNYLKKLMTALLLFCCTVASAADFEVGGVYYNILSEEDKTVEVKSGSNKYTGAVTIPASVTYNSTTYGVTSIGDRAFFSCDGLTSVTIGNGVTSIGKDAFYSCDGLTSVTIGNGVTSIGVRAFYRCSSLTSIEIPASVTSIGNDAFRWCSGLTSIEIPASVTGIGQSAFAYCDGLTSVTIGNGVTSIGDRAFYGCAGLTSVTIGNGVTSIGNYAFNDCDALTSIVVGDGNSVYDSRGNCNAIIETASNTLIVGCKNTIILASVTSIGERAFYYCTSLASIEIPSSVTSIGDEAFYDCTGLTSVTIGNGVTSIGDRAFYGCAGLTSIVIPSSVTSIGNYAFNDCDALTSIVVDEGNTVYDSRGNCNAIIETASNTLIVGCKNTIIPASVTSIGVSAFRSCTALTSIEIPASVTSIGDRAFAYCSGLTSIEIPASVTSIDDEAFYWCSGLTSVTSHIAAENLFVPGYDAFYRIDKDACTLYVPAGAKSTYAATDGWKEFKNIVEMSSDGSDATAIESVETECAAPAVYYDLSGRRVENPEKGIYIVNGRKVFIK